ncbi:MAG: transglutaminase domain-containing protein [Chloroflexota bacterium]
MEQIKIISGKIVIPFRRAISRFSFSNFLTLVCAGLGFLTLAVAVWSVEKASWITPQPSLITALVLATVAGILLANTGLPKKVTIALMLTFGLAIVFWQTVRLFTATNDSSSFQLWWQAVSDSRPSEGTVFFAIFLVFVTWLIGFISVWFIVRQQNAWVTIASGTVMLLVNLSNLPREDYYFFALYFLAAIVLLGIAHLARKSHRLTDWADTSIRRGLGYSFMSLAGIAVITVGIVHFMPVPPLDNIGLKINAAPFSGARMEKIWFNIFHSVPSKWAVVKSETQEELLFKDRITGSTRINFLISGASSEYWPIWRYDRYEPWGWVSTAEPAQALSAGVPLPYPEKSSESAPIAYTVDNRLKTDVVLSRGEVISASIPVRLQTFSEGADISSQGEAPPDIAAIASTQLIRPYQKYRVIANVATATPEELAGAGEEYPAWVRSRYLQLPDNLPDRVWILGLEITSRAKTPYDKVVAIQDYLKTYWYDERAQPPPDGRDGVDYFLFGSRRGFCVHFASAMAILLRSSDVPARLSTGYLSREVDKATGNYVIRARDYHSRIEVYFPEYGWIEFEATPRGVSLDDGDFAASSGYYPPAPEDEGYPLWMLDGEFDPAAGGATRSVSRAPTLPWPYIYLFSFIFMLAVATFMAREYINRWLGKLERVQTAVQAYDRMCYLAHRSNSGPGDFETPSEYGRRLSGYLPLHQEAIDTIVVSYLGTQYGPRKVLENKDTIKLQKAWVELCPALFKYMLRLKKWSPVRLLMHFSV